MAFDLWLAFVASSIVLTLIPGPSVLMVVGQALTHGRATALRCVMGDLVGGVVLIALAMAGVGALLAASALLFQAVKWAGVAYLIWLGVEQIRTARRPIGAKATRSSGFKVGFITGVLNPKAIMFYVAFLSQFADPDAQFAPQFMALVATSTVIVGGILSGYVLLASEARNALRGEIARRRIGYAGGGALIGGGMLVAATR
jgi:homoserine/homoserine lactone efflux protein